MRRSINWDVAARKRLAHQRAIGMSMAEIAVIWGCSPNNISVTCRRFNIAGRSRPKPALVPAPRVMVVPTAAELCRMLSPQAQREETIARMAASMLARGGITRADARDQAQREYARRWG